MAKPRKYAEGTDVSAERSRAELEALLKKHGATEFAVYTSPQRARFVYRLQGKLVQHTVEHPQEADFQQRTISGPKYRKEQLERLAENEWKRRWRALVLVCKAKLEIIESGGSTFEREFLADMMLADGSCVADTLLPAIAKMYEDGNMPNLLLGPGS